MKSLSKLPLKRLSARNCKIQIIDREFLQNFRGTLEKLDLSCNNLIYHFGEITNGVANSTIHTLVLDHINLQPNNCSWSNISDSLVRPLGTTTLKILSVQANQFGEQSNIDFRSHCSHLIYLDLSQNSFGNIAFYVAEAFKGQKVPNMDKLFFHVRRLQAPSLRYLGLNGVTENLKCGEIDANILDCDEDSNLFTSNESYSWDHNYDPDIIDYQLLANILEQDWILFVYLELRDPRYVEMAVRRAIKGARRLNAYYTSDKVVSRAIHDIWNRPDGEGVLTYFGSMRYLISNLTELSMQHNDIFGGPSLNADGRCSNITIDSNNLDTLDLSYSKVIYIPCTKVQGLKYLTNLTCVHCQISDWDARCFLGLPVTYLDMRWNALGKRLRNDRDGLLFKHAPRVEHLLLGGQTDGIHYFHERNMFQHNPNLTHLDLHHNKLRSWNISLSLNPKLKFLNLADNLISYIDSIFREEIDTLSRTASLKVNMNGNYIMCVNIKKMLDYIHWLINSPAVIEPDKLRCGNLELLIVDYYKQAMEKTTVIPSAASPSNYRIAVIVVSSVCALAILISVMMCFVTRHTLLRRWTNRSNGYENFENSSTTMVFASNTLAFLEDAASKIIL